MKLRAEWAIETLSVDCCAERGRVPAYLLDRKLELAKQVTEVSDLARHHRLSLSAGLYE